MNHDDRYLKALLSGDDMIIREVYFKIFPKVRSFILSNKGGHADALDIFHDALMHIIIKHKEKNLEINSFEAYLYVVCKNLWKKKLKKQVINQDLKTLKDTTPNQKEHKNEQESMDLYVEKFQLLSSNCKEILGNYFNGWSYEELAKELNYSNINTVRQRVFKCRSKLIKLIKSDHRYKKLKSWNFI